MKIAIACSGLGHIKRGFESFAEDLFRNLELEDEIEATLFKGGGVRAPKQIPLWNIPRSSLIWRVTEQQIDPYIGEQMTFALPLARCLKRSNFDLVHISDCQLGSILLRLFPGDSREFKIVFTNGGALTPPHYHRFDYVQQVNPVEMERALEQGLNESRMILLPHGVSMEDYGQLKQGVARRRLEIPQEVPLVLSVGAHEAAKHLDFLIQEMAVADARAHLLIAGEETSSQTKRLRALASRLLGSRVSFGTFPHEFMPTVYAAADLCVIASRREGFGLTLIEAMASGIPVIHHDEPAMNWIAADGGVPVDMNRQHRLSKTLNALLENSSTRLKLAQRARQRAEESFSWETLLPQYLKMYERALSLPPNL